MALSFQIEAEASTRADTASVFWVMTARSSHFFIDQGAFSLHEPR